MAIIYSSSKALRDDYARFVDDYQATGGRVTFQYMREGMSHMHPLLRDLSGRTAVKDAKRRLIEWVNVLAEESKNLFDNRKSTDAIVASANGSNNISASYYLYATPQHPALPPPPLDGS
ncbi:hypothetical protein BGX20_006736 [Mortierella sp. AD010]|nr:hypothetical protein BGX20_006736 [Mortierella sp. AD010]